MLFINVIGDLPREVQARLREVLTANADVRIIAGTRRDLDRDVASGRFADDLFFLLAGGRVELPSLRERDGDLALLARHFWSQLALPGEEASAEVESSSSSFREDFLPRFEHYPWPGNVRELKAAVAARKTLGELGQAYRSEEARDKGLDFLSAVIEDDLPFPSARARAGDFNGDGIDDLAIITPVNDTSRVCASAPTAQPLPPPSGCQAWASDS